MLFPTSIIPVPLVTSGVLGYVLTFAASFAEAVAFLGMFVPGMTIVVAISGLAALGFYQIWILFLLSSTGAALGDIMSYEIGRVGKRPLQKRPRIWKHIEKAELKFKKYGVFAVGLGRFVAPLRGVMPLAAGVLGMERPRFYVAVLFFSVIWGVGSVCLGYFLGSASRLLTRTPGEAEWLFLSLAMVLIALVLLRRKKRALPQVEMER